VAAIDCVDRKIVKIMSGSVKGGRLSVGSFWTGSSYFLK
jgi:hypothetical protein